MRCSHLCTGRRGVGIEHTPGGHQYVLICCRRRCSPVSPAAVSPSGSEAVDPLTGGGWNVELGWSKLTYKGVDFSGSDISSEVVNCVDNCQEKCTENPNCQFYTYHNGSFFHPDHRHRCYMKRVIIMPTPSQVKKMANVVSGFTLRNCRSAQKSQD
ncbi:hypothetical protein AMECASPLE_021166 [Ameca splendens]|uniref:Apple domain-containing protein n=1 Tax=Ameca splendens TaxID=208324 RepID=A0ABV0Z1K1_9TELE